MSSGFERPRPEANPYRTVFNHVGLCVSDRERSRRFYEGVLGFQFWWELEPPDTMTAQVVQLPEPLGVKATYLVRDGFVLELIDYSMREVHAGPTRVMDEVGLTHISLSVSDLAGAKRKQLMNLLQRIKTTLVSADGAEGAQTILANGTRKRASAANGRHNARAAP